MLVPIAAALLQLCAVHASPVVDREAKPLCDNWLVTDAFSWQQPSVYMICIVCQLPKVRTKWNSNTTSPALVLCQWSYCTSGHQKDLDVLRLSIVAVDVSSNYCRCTVLNWVWCLLPLLLVTGQNLFLVNTAPVIKVTLSVFTYLD